VLSLSKKQQEESGQYQEIVKKIKKTDIRVHIRSFYLYFDLPPLKVNLEFSPITHFLKN
jgi:hypothetical protein